MRSLIPEEDVPDVGLATNACATINQTEHQQFVRGVFELNVGDEIAPLTPRPKRIAEIRLRPHRPKTFRITQ